MFVCSFCRFWLWHRKRTYRTSVSDIHTYYNITMTELSNADICPWCSNCFLVLSTHCLLRIHLKCSCREARIKCWKLQPRYLILLFHFSLCYYTTILPNKVQSLILNVFITFIMCIRKPPLANLQMRVYVNCALAYTHNKNYTVSGISI